MNIMAEQQKKGAEGRSLVPQKGSYSAVWNFFGFDECDVDQVRVLCKLCSCSFKTSQGNTTNLVNHLKSHHRVQYQEFQRLKTQHASTLNTQPSTTQTTIKGTLFNAIPYSPCSQRHKEITEAITYHLAKDMCPLATVSNDGFKNMIAMLDKRYNIPSRNHFTKVALPSLYTKCRLEIEREIRSIEYFASTTDLWSSRTAEPYLSLTVHFIDSDFAMKSKLLQTSFFPQAHTGELIAAGLKEAISAWGLLEERLVCITTDNAANMIRAASVNNWTRLHCFGHRLHLAIENAMKDSRMDRAVGLCKKLVSTFSYSWKRKREFSAAQKELKLPEHSLKTECPTRWGSRQAMIERVIEQQKATAHVLSSDKKSRHLIPTWQDMDVLEAINKSLHPLVDFTDALLGEKYVSVSFVKPVLHLFNSSILKVKDDDTDLSRAIKSKILEYLNEKYSNPHIQALLDMASTVDPRFKMSYVAEDNQTSIQTRLKAEMQIVAMMVIKRAAL
ncbi:E3 SUMO-protein ligase ZBED1-like [Triplophysa rosa]|uniref:E3 SUMO-protein ligase ZBED1-like n=1 Tax=Triplophysa rosa TaxID=992332 RepID=UPI002545CCF9|nr:E3 SUMO-protein ligase ZBED1-like [Triplophysa rosa]